MKITPQKHESQVIKAWVSALTLKPKFAEGLFAGLELERRENCRRGKSSLNGLCLALYHLQAFEAPLGAPADMESTIKEFVSKMNGWLTKKKTRPWESAVSIVPPKGRLSGRSELAAFAVMVGAMACIAATGTRKEKLAAHLNTPGTGLKFYTRLLGDPATAMVKEALGHHASLIADKFLEVLEATSRTPCTRFLSPLVEAARKLAGLHPTCVDVRFLLVGSQIRPEVIQERKSRCGESMLVLLGRISPEEPTFSCVGATLASQS